MASDSEHVAALAEVATRLHASAVVSAHAVEEHRGTPAGEAADRQLEHTLDRLALLHAGGRYENLTTEAIVETAIDGERRLALALPDPDAAAAAAARAKAITDAARRGRQLHIRRDQPAPRSQRGVYVEPLRPELAHGLRHDREPHVSWRDGLLVVLPEAEIDALRAAGDTVYVLFLDPDELLDLDAAGDWDALEAELERRLAIARADPDRVGDSRERHVRRTLLRQSAVLRNLRQRLDADHPGAHRALRPLVAEQRAVLERSLTAAAPPPEDALGATIAAERELQSLVSRWAAEPGAPTGVRGWFQAVADAGTRLPDLESHHS